MADYIIKNGELCHYGVIGMKWGVRKGRTSSEYSAEYKKAGRKLNKLDSKYEKARAKAHEATVKANRKTGSVLASKKAKQKAYENLNESRRKVVKASNKADKWVKRMEKEFAKVDMSLAKEHSELGKKYIDALDLMSLR